MTPLLICAVFMTAIWLAFRRQRSRLGMLLIVCFVFALGVEGTAMNNSYKQPIVNKQQNRSWWGCGDMGSTNC